MGKQSIVSRMQLVKGEVGYEGSVIRLAFRVAVNNRGQEARAGAEWDERKISHFHLSCK